MYKKILVPLDGSTLAEQILPYARVLAEAYKIPITLLRVDNPHDIAMYGPRVQDGGYLKKAAANYLPASVTVDHVVELGKPADVIVDWAKTESACLIAMATHGLSGFQRWVLGSVANKVIRAAVNPMLLIRPAEGRDPAEAVQFKSVIVPLDGSGLAERTLPHVKVLAKALRLEVHLVRIYSAPAGSYIAAEGVYVGTLPDWSAEVQKDAETYLTGIAEELRLGGLEGVYTIAVEGEAADEIIDLARHTRATLVAMSTHGRSGIGRWVLGSVTEKVIQHCRDPVLMIRAG